MRKRLVGTTAGRGLQQIARWHALRSLPLANPEQAAATANAILADQLITRLCPPGGTFLDIGAHIGSVFSAVHAATPSARIIAIEADPDKARSLRARFPYCALYECAVGEAEGEAVFYRSAGKSGYNSLMPQDSHEQNKVKVQLRPLDALLPEAQPDVIKMDIEGAELGALKGGAGLIAQARPVIMFESMGEGENALGYSPDGLWDWLDALDYGICTPDRLAHDAPPLPREAFLDAHRYPFRTHNYFAVPSEKREATRDRARSILNVRV